MACDEIGRMGTVSLCDVGRGLLATARGHEREILATGNPEALHQYRVALRKLRSVAGQFKHVNAKERAVELRRELGEMAARTNALRDLDAMVMTAGARRLQLPEALHEGLGLVERDLRKRRAIELRSVRRWLRSDAYGELRVACEALLAGSVVEWKEVAKGVARRLRKVRRRVKRLGNGASDAELHGLRLQCKKLRYLL